MNMCFFFFKYTNQRYAFLKSTIKDKHKHVNVAHEHSQVLWGYLLSMIHVSSNEMTKAESMEYNNQASNSGLQQIIRKKGFRRAVAAIANTCHFPAVRKSTQQLLYWLLSARHGPKEEWGRNNRSKEDVSVTLSALFWFCP